MKQRTGIMTDHCQTDATVTYFLIFAVGENIQCHHNSSSSISIFLGNTSHFIPIQWHSKLSILDTEQQIYFNIRELKQTDAAAVNRQISIQFRVMDVKGRPNSLGLESFWMEICRIAAAASVCLSSLLGSLSKLTRRRSTGKFPFNSEWWMSRADRIHLALSPSEWKFAGWLPPGQFA